MLQPYDPPFVTLFAELADRVADAGLIEDLPPGGTFERRTINDRDYWYHRAYSRPLGKDKARYVGPASPELDARVARHAALKPETSRAAGASSRRSSGPASPPRTPSRAR